MMNLLKYLLDRIKALNDFKYEDVRNIPKSLHKNIRETKNIKRYYIKVLIDFKDYLERENNESNEGYYKDVVYE